MKKYVPAIIDNNFKIKTGIILAAGIGLRIQKFEANKTTVKPLISVNGVKLLLRTIRSHEIAGCSKIIIITGWQSEYLEQETKLQYHGSTELLFIYNKEYTLKNGISVLCARPYISGEFLLTMSDHILDDKIMLLIKNHPPPDKGATLCVDFKIDTLFDLDDATKVFVNGNMIKKIGKNLKTYNCIDTGVFICTDGLMNSLEKIYGEKGDVSLSDGIQTLADSGKMEALDIGDAFWQDVDTPEMLVHAEKLIRFHENDK